MSDDLEKALLPVLQLDQFTIPTDDERERIAQEKVHRALREFKQGNRFKIEYRGGTDKDFILDYVKKLDAGNVKFGLDYRVHSNENEFGGLITGVVYDRAKVITPAVEQRGMKAKHWFVLFIYLFCIWMIGLGLSGPRYGDPDDTVF